MIIKINDIQIKSPHNIKVGVFRLSKSGRLASGKMVMDIIAQKRRLDLSWEVISGKHLNDIIDVLDSAVFYTVEYADPKNPNELTTMKAYVGDINQVLIRSSASRAWKDVSLALIEQ